MKEMGTGDLVESIAGHDAGKVYVIFDMDREYVYLVDGKIRTLERPKKKKKKHTRLLDLTDALLTEKVINRTVKNEEIKRFIKMLANMNSRKEVE